jgi:tetratricopeptide (TPR) repeat protein
MVRNIRGFVAVALVIAATYASGPPSAIAASVGQPTTSTVTQSGSTTPSSSDPNLYRELGGLQSQVDSQGDLVKLILVFLTLLLSLSVAGFVFAERRSRQIHALAIQGETAAQVRIAEAHELAMKGEAAGQARAGEVHTGFLEGSLNTLSLVNQTLELERVASERAGRAIEDKARHQLNALDQAAKALLAAVPVDDDHALVTNQSTRAELTSLAAKINSFEINRFILPSDMPLTPHCQFIRGMQLHLDQRFADAFREWEAIALSDAAPTDLRSLTWYWIGRERTNLAQFDEAEAAFRHALDHASKERSYELQRIRLELKFFDAQRCDAERLVSELKRLIEEVGAVESEAAAKALPRIWATLANVHHELAQEHRTAGRVEQAREHFEAAATIFQSIRDEKWAVFGLAEALWWLGRRDEAEQLFAKEARRFAQDEYVHRTEFRTKVLARSAELLCCARSKSLRGDVDHVYQDVLDALGHVDERMTVYSEIQRRNVSKKAFRGDMDLLVEQAKCVPDPVVPSA